MVMHGLLARLTPSRLAGRRGMSIAPGPRESNRTKGPIMHVPSRSFFVVGLNLAGAALALTLALGAGCNDDNNTLQSPGTTPGPNPTSSPAQLPRQVFSVQLSSVNGSGVSG